MQLRKLVLHCGPGTVAFAGTNGELHVYVGEYAAPAIAEGARSQEVQPDCTMWVLEEQATSYIE